MRSQGQKFEANGDQRLQKQRSTLPSILACDPTDCWQTELQQCVVSDSGTAHATHVQDIIGSLPSRYLSLVQGIDHCCGRAV